MDPGDRTPWLIGYGFLALFFFANAIRLGLPAFGPRRTIQRQGLVGLIIGSLISFTPVLLLCLFGPRREFFNLLSGVGFGFLAAPFWGAIGGMVGTGIGLRSGRVNRIP